MGISIELQPFLSRLLSLEGALWLLGISGFAIGAIYLYWHRLQSAPPIALWKLASIGGVAFGVGVMAITLIQMLGIKQGPSAIEWLLLTSTFFVAGIVGCAASIWVIRRRLMGREPNARRRPPVIVALLGFWVGAALGHFVSTSLVIIVLANTVG